MASHPIFPEFKPFDLEDRDFIHSLLWQYQPRTSELTFTNLFMWRFHYGFQWSMYKNWLLILCNKPSEDVYALQPVGPPSRLEVTRLLLQWLREEKKISAPRIERADQRLVSEIEEERNFFIKPTDEHFDYIYQAQNLIQLAGRKYHSKKNFINTFERSYAYTYISLDSSHVKECKTLQEQWCVLHRCDEDMNLLGEWEAVCEALTHFDSLRIEGGGILINDKVEAFALGERLDNQTAVVHIEKANPQIRGLYTVINQQFCEKQWQQVSYINREQDLGEPGLRKAKQSYHPVHLVEKFRIQLKEDA